MEEVRLSTAYVRLFLAIKKRAEEDGEMDDWYEHWGETEADFAAIYGAAERSVYHNIRVTRVSF